MSSGVAVDAFERLEFGKVEQADGSVPGRLEHRELGRSVGFPASLARWCMPGQLGAARPGPGGNSLFQPVRAEGVAAIYCREIPMPESDTGRQYRRARYLAVPGGVSPLTAFAAMAAAPLDALPAGPVAALPAAPDLPAAADSELVDQVAAQCLTGASVTLLGDLPEDEFWKLAGGVWERLPDPLRPWFSAAFHPGPELASLLCLCGGATAARGPAWDTASKKWLRRHEAQAIEGALAFRYRDSVSEVLATGPQTTAELPRLDDPAVVTFFRTAGIVLADAAGIQHLHELLAAGENISAIPDYTEEALRREAVRVLIPALEGPAAEAAARLLWQRLPAWRDALEAVLPSAGEGSGAWTAGLLLAIAKSGAAAVLERIPESHWEQLPQYLRDILLLALTDGLQRLDTADIEAHERLLLRPSPPPVYVEFLRSSGWRLAAAADRLSFPDNRGLQFAEAIRKHAASNETLLLVRLFRSQHHSATGSGNPAFQKALRDAVDLRWRNLELLDDAQQDDVLRWIRDLSPEPRPLQLRLVEAAAKSDEELRQVAAGQTDTIADQVAARRVPPAVRPAIAKLVLEWPDLFAHYVMAPATAEGWLRIAAHWPPAIGELFGFLAREVAAPAENQPRADSTWYSFSMLPTATVELMLTRWCSDEERFTTRLPVVADRLLGLILRQDSSGPALLWRSMCGGVFGFSEMELAGSSVTGRDVRILARLNAALSPEWRYRLTAAELERALRTQHRGWKLLFLLLSYPAAAFQPTVAQVEALCAYRAEVQLHLAEPGVHPGRAAALRLVLAGFQELEYDAEGPTQALGRGSLWAIYRGLPPGVQGNLGEAIDFFAGDSWANRVRLCRIFLEDGIRRGQRLPTLNKVVSEFVFAVVSRSLRAQQRRELLAALIRPVPGTLVPVRNGGTAIQLAPLNHFSQVFEIDPSLLEFFQYLAQEYADELTEFWRRAEMRQERPWL